MQACVQVMLMIFYEKNWRRHECFCRRGDWLLAFYRPLPFVTSFIAEPCARLFLSAPGQTPLSLEGAPFPEPSSTQLLFWRQAFVI